jgi:hypothetical protein
MDSENRHPAARAFERAHQVAAAAGAARRRSRQIQGELQVLQRRWIVRARVVDAGAEVTRRDG